jgi:hypothetical protein
MQQPLQKPVASSTAADYDIELADVVLGNTNVGLSGIAAQKMVHVGFIRKVYGLLTTQLALTVLISYACTLGDRAALINAYSYLQFPLLFVNLGLLALVTAVRKRSPLNLLALLAWTSVMSLSMGAVTAVYVEGGNTDLLFQVRRKSILFFPSPFSPRVRRCPAAATLLSELLACKLVSRSSSGVPRPSTLLPPPSGRRYHGHGFPRADGVCIPIQNRLQLHAREPVHVRRRADPVHQWLLVKRAAWPSRDFL